jgi:hypothetical protein
MYDGVADHISNTCSCHWKCLNALDSGTQKPLPQIQPLHLNFQLLNLLLQLSEYQTQLHCLTIQSLKYLKTITSLNVIIAINPS